MANFSNKIFKYRSYTPIPFLVLMVIFQDANIMSISAGLAMALLGEFFRLWGVSYAGSETRTTDGVGGTYLVISGAYGHLRNPLYLGNILMYIGIGIMSMALFPYLQLASLLFFIWQYLIIISEEEKFLRTKFGSHFEDYLVSVPKMIPRLTKYVNPDIPQPQLKINMGFRSERRTLQAFSIIVLIILIQFILKRFVLN